MPANVVKRSSKCIFWSSVFTKDSAFKCYLCIQLKFSINELDTIGYRRFF
jgi:hypothetical protein